MLGARLSTVRFRLAAVVAVSVGLVWGEDTTGPAGWDSSGTRIAINQVDTSDFPRVRLHATVTRSGRPVTGLTAMDFRVREDGEAQGPIEVAFRGKPLSVVLLIDISGSMRSAIPETKEAAIAFLGTLSGGDRVQVMTFEEVVRTIYPLGGDFERARAAISEIRHRGDTALYDGIHEAISAIRDVPGRRAIIVLSDGVDDDGQGRQLSSHNLDEPLMLGIRTNIPIYTIGLGSRMDEGVLRTFAGTTGAEYVNAPTDDQLKELYLRIGRALGNQYTVEYTSSRPREPGPRMVALDLTLSGSKPYAAPRAAVDDSGRSFSYRPASLTAEEQSRLARLAGLDRFAAEFRIDGLEDFREDVPVDWPGQIPQYGKATSLALEPTSGGEKLSFETPESVGEFAAAYEKILREAKWTIRARSSGGLVAGLTADKGRSEMTVNVRADDATCRVEIEFSGPAIEPIVIAQDGVNQVVAADGRDVIISSSDCAVVISGGCGTLRLRGNSNQVQADYVGRLEVPADGNRLILGILGQAEVSGNNNEISYGAGPGGERARVNATGQDNQITRLE